jgi:uncharacterized surface protein with fasciclin (FAS1) repeats
VCEQDVKFAGGVVHIVDSVLAPPINITGTAKLAGLTSLVGAVEAADLMHVVDHLAGVTVFAPTNDAFKAIGNVVQNLTTEQLAEILTYHVVPSVAYSTALKDGMELNTANGKKLTITIDGEKAFVNGARVVMSDVLVNAGVVHVIDG